MYIYLLRNMVNGKIYVGKTVNTPEKRFRQHIDASKQKKTYLHRSISKHGEEHFVVEVLEVVHDKNLLDSKEIYWISKLEPEYNMTTGGEGGNTTVKYTEERKRERSSKSSASVKNMWDSMSEDERKYRMEKTHSKTDYKAHSEKLSISRRRYFANETEEERDIRIEKAKMGAKKIRKKRCSYCDKEVHPGSIQRHEESCLENPDSKNFGKKVEKKVKYIYTLLDENRVIHVTTSFKRFCEQNNLSRYLLMKNLGNVVESVDARTNNANAITVNTFGWCLLRIDDQI
jgi:group I intron endonuclease